MRTVSRIDYFGIQKKSLTNEFEYHLERIELLGYTLIGNVLSAETCDALAASMTKLNDAQNDEFGGARLKELKDYGIVRDMFAKEEIFLELAMHPMSLAYVEKILGSTAILHLQNGIVLEPHTKHDQAHFHRDFAKDFVCEKVLALNTFFLIDDFTEQSGGTWIAPFTHKDKVVPSDRYLDENAVQITGKRGSLLIFDGLLIHKAGDNESSNFRRAINHQYTRPFIKQQVDYVQMMYCKLDPESRAAQLLGFWSRPPRSIEEYRVDEDKRRYRKGQG